MAIQRDVVAQIERSGVASPDAFAPDVDARMARHAEAAAARLHRRRRRQHLRCQRRADQFLRKLARSGRPHRRPQLLQGASNPDRSSNASGSSWCRAASSGGWATVIACKVTGPNGEFLGVVTRAITPANFESFFASVALAPGASISMHHRDGTLLARFPHADSHGRAEFQDRARGTAEGLRAEPLYHASGQPDRRREPADLLARARSNFPIVIVATTTVAAALADWQRADELPDRRRRHLRALDRRACCSWSCAGCRAITRPRSGA